MVANVQQTFYYSLVREDHRNFLSFLWHKDTDINKEVIEYRMKVHVFGLQRVIREGAQEHGAETVKFVERRF